MTEGAGKISIDGLPRFGGGAILFIETPIERITLKAIDDDDGASQYFTITDRRPIERGA